MRKSEEIIRILRKELQEGRWKEESRFPSEEQLMQRFHVSRITMNKITEQLVQEKYIKRGKGGAGATVLNTRPFPIGQIACFGDLLHPYYSRIIHSVFQRATILGYGVNFFAPEADMINYYLEKVRKSDYIGLLVCRGIGPIPEDYPMPVVYLDSAFPQQNAFRCSVACNNYQASFRMAETAVQRGHREILVFSSVIPIEENRMKRINGFRDSLIKSGISDVEERICIAYPRDFSAVARMFRRKYAQFPETTIVLTDSDDIALHLLRHLWEKNLLGKITVTGFGNIISSNSIVPIATVEQYPEEIGASGVDELLYNAAHPESPHVGEILLEADLLHTELIPDLSSLKT